MKIMLTFTHQRILLNAFLAFALLFLSSKAILAQVKNSTTPTVQWKTAAAVPRGAEEVIGVSANGKFYMFGGLGPKLGTLGYGDGVRSCYR